MSAKEEMKTNKKNEPAFQCQKQIEKAFKFNYKNMLLNMSKSLIACINKIEKDGTANSTANTGID